MARFIITTFFILSMALSSVARDSAKQDFLNALFKGKEYPVALCQSESYPWRIDYNSVKTTSRQDDVNSNCWFALDVFVPADSASVTFDYQVRYHKETYGWAKYANLTCCIDGVEVFSNNGTDKTESATIKIAKGYHKLKWNLSLGEAWENWDYFGKIENMHFEGISDESPLPEYDRLSIPFYNVEQNTLKKETITITNVGNQPYIVNSIAELVSPFKVIDGSQQTINPGDTGKIVIGFEPEYEGFYDDDILLSSNIGDISFPASGISTNGYVVVSPVPGGLSSVLKNTNCENVSIMGHLNRADQYFLNKLQKCKHLSLAGTDIEVVTNGGIDNLWKLKSIVLPKTLKVLDTTWANNATFEGKTQITLYDLTCIQCLSPIPPKVLEFYDMGGSSEEKQLGNLRPSTRLLVPEEYASNYTSSNIWNKLTVISTTNEVTTLRVNLDVSKPENYSGMKLYLNNLDTCETSFLTVDGNSEYSFVGLHPYYLYNISLTDISFGRNVGEIDVTGLEIPESRVVLSDVKNVYKIEGLVYDDDFLDVTSDVDFEWSDENGRVVSTTKTATAILAGDSLKCSMSLSESLGRKYINPRPVSFNSTACDSIVTIQLERIPSLTLNGTIKNSVHKKPVGDASILINQYLNGKYATTSKVSTDSEGRFSIDLMNDSTVISVIVPDYEPYKLGLPNLDDLHNSAEMLIQPCEGVPIGIQFTYQRKAASNEEPTIENWYPDYANVDFTAFNKTTNKEIVRKDYKWPTLTLQENCAVGDSIIIMASSKNDSFYTVETSCQIDSLGHANAIIPIVELGAVFSNFDFSDNQSTTGLLFGPDSKLIDSRTYLSKKVSFENLKEGKHSLVTMGTNRYYNSIPSLFALHEYQLKEGIDYVVNEVYVKRGEISSIKCDSIPAFDSEKHRLTASSTYFTVNKSSVVAGSYVTIDTKVDFLPSIKEKAKNTCLSIELPSGVSFVKNSLLVGGNQSSNYQISGTQLNIPISKTGERIRFCLQPFSYGNYSTGGSIKFTIDDTEFVQPIGTASFSASSITLSAPKITPNKEIVVSGNTIANAEVTIYDNTIAVGKTNASSSGKWRTSITLEKPYNHSHHHIYAKIESSDGIEMQSETKDVVYDKNEIVVNKVTMYHDNPEVGKTFAVEFDFLNPSPVTTSYTYYIYNKNFTFTIDLTDNDPEKVSNVVLWVTTGKGNEIGLDAKYDDAQGLWVAAGQFGNMYDGDIPVNVAVSFNQCPIVELDSDILDLNWNKHISYVNSQNKIKEIFEESQVIINEELNKNNISEDLINDQLDFLLTLFECDGENDEITENDSLESFSDIIDEITSWGDELVSDTQNISEIPTDKFCTWNSNLGEIILTTTIKPNDLDEFQCNNKGYVKYHTTDGSFIYTRTEDNHITWVDFKRGFIIESVFDKDTITSQEKRKNIYKISDFTESWWDDFRNNGLERILEGTVHDLAQDFVLDNSAAFLRNRHIQRARNCIRRLKQIPVEYKRSRELWRESLHNLRLAAMNVENWRTVTENAIGILELLMNDIAFLVEEKKMLDQIDNNMPEVFDCAWAKYPDEIQQMYMNLFDYRKEIGRTSARRMVYQLGEAMSNIMVVGSAMQALDNTEVRQNWQTINDYIDVITSYNSVCSKEEKQRLIDEGYFESNCPDAPNKIDPSGYVYETVPSNRLQGVKATCYQKVKTENMYGDIIEKAVIWDARNYEQENPLYTDDQGLYRWDVPEGLWQVKFEKEGYETAYTDWLPVPPPQLDINIPMVQYSQPDIIKAEWTEEGIEVVFSKYMMPSTLNERNIIVRFNDQDICGNIELANEEALSKDNDEHSFASVVKVTPNLKLGEKDVIDLLIKGSVKSYAGIALGEDKVFSLSKVPTVTEYIIPDSIPIHKDEQKLVHVQVLSKEASNGNTLLISNSSPMICEVENLISLDENGEGDIYLYGIMPGSATLTLSIDGFNRSKQIPVVVSDVNDKIVATPYPSIDGSEIIVEGTEVYLFCDTEDATIYYTIDGSCPCDYGKRIKYSGSPIIVDHPFELKIMACKPGFEDSDIATYNYSNIISSVSEIQTETIYSISPKITRDYVILNINGAVASRVAVWSMDGGIIQTKTNVPDCSRINLGSLPSGVYIITIDISGHRYSEKIIKQ